MPRPSAVDAVTAPVASAISPSASPASASHAPRPGQQQRALRSGQRGGDVADRLLGERAAERHRLRQPWLRRRRHRPRLERRDVVGDREHGRHPVGERVLDRDDGRGRGIRSAHRVGARTDRRRQRDLVDAPRAAARGGLVAHYQHERDVRLHGLRQRGQRVREARAVGGRRRGQAAAGSVVRVGRDHATRLVPHGGESDVGGALERIEEVRVAVAHHAEHVVDVAGEGGGDVRGDCGHVELQRQGRTVSSVCVSRAAIGCRGCVPLFRAPARCFAAPDGSSISRRRVGGTATG